MCDGLEKKLSVEKLCIRPIFLSTWDRSEHSKAFFFLKVFQRFQKSVKQL